MYFILGEDSLMYLYLQKQFSWTLENYTLFNVYATLLSGLLFILKCILLNIRHKLSIYILF